ncbi:MAG: protein kinase domain-containing protein [Bdellovibrionota bacterium]
MNATSIPNKIDRYELLESIGSGGMGLIFKALDTKLKRHVAIKVISDRSRDETMKHTLQQRFFNEARAAGSLSHPNIVGVHDVGEDRELVYIVMEYIEGETLEKLLKTKGPLNLNQLVKMAKEIAGALEFAHEKGIIHRDIKPSNIIIEASSGRAKILDFGIAKFVNEEDLKLTSTGMVLGSTHYLSPEHITGKNPDRRSDIFSFGSLLYEASTGSLPFRGENSSSILYKIVHFDPLPPAEVSDSVPSEISQLIMKCLAKAPESRFASLSSFCQGLEKFEHSLTGSVGITATHRADMPSSKIYFVRDTQLLTALVAQKKLTTNQAAGLRDKIVYEHLLRDSDVSEDDLAATIADCLSLAWIPRNRIRTIKIKDDAFEILPVESLKRNNVLIFYKDDQKNSLSLLIDGNTDFQKDPQITRLFQKHQIKIYVGGRNSIQQLIDSRAQSEDSSSTSRLFSTQEHTQISSTDFKKILLIDTNRSHHQAFLSFFQTLKDRVVIMISGDEAYQRLKSERFSLIWARRDLIGDELEFETNVLKSNPSCEVRIFENLQSEIFEDSISYQKVREMILRFFKKIFIKKDANSIAQAEEIASFAVKLAKVETRNTKELDEVYFFQLILKAEPISEDRESLIKILDEMFRFRYFYESIRERYDGRGTLGLKAHQIPLPSRVAACLQSLLKVNTHWKTWSSESLNELRKHFDRLAGKQLDPVLCAEIIDMIRPSLGEQSQKKVLIVDPDLKYAKELASHLIRAGFKTEIFDDGMKALSSAKSARPDLVLTEVVVPRLDGFSLSLRLQSDQQLKELPVVFVSHSDNPEHSVKALKLGAIDFLEKDLEPEFLLAKIERLLKSAS